MPAEVDGLRHAFGFLETSNCARSRPTHQIAALTGGLNWKLAARAACACGSIEANLRIHERVGAHC